jgi:condensin complex subunit 1
MRNATLEVLGVLIKELSKSEEEVEASGSGHENDNDRASAQKNQLEGFFDLLFERFLDTNSYVRSKVATIFLRILECVLVLVVLLLFCWDVGLLIMLSPPYVSLSSKFPKQRLRLVKEALRSLEDKASSVRKNCIAILTKSILTHPYGRMHGGELSMKEWTERYERLRAELKELDVPIGEDPEEEEEQPESKESPKEANGDAAAEGQGEAGEKEDDEDGDEEKPHPNGKAKDNDDDDSGDSSDSTETSSRRKPKKTAPAKDRRRSDRRKSGLEIAAANDDQSFATLDHDKLLKLRLTQRYYSDALAFIGQIERAIPIIAQLIASTVKSEVLEAMDFFKTAHEYKIEAAEVCIYCYPLMSVLH